MAGHEGYQAERIPPSSRPARPQETNAPAVVFAACADSAPNRAKQGRIVGLPCQVNRTGSHDTGPLAVRNAAPACGVNSLPRFARGEGSALGVSLGPAL